MKITIAQLNPIIGDIEGNLEKAVLALKQAHEDAAELLVFPELFLTGYPPRDLLERKGFIEKAERALKSLSEVSADFPGVKIIMGAPTFSGKKEGRGLYNSAVLISGGKILDSYHKVLLPIYDVFDERRYFDSPKEEIHVLGDVFGTAICEDMWEGAPGLFTEHNYSLNPIALLAQKGAKVLIDISASPFYAGKEKDRYEIIKKHAIEHELPFVFVNQVGGQDELIFDGQSIVVNKKGEPIEIFPAFKEQVKTVDLDTIETQEFSPLDKIKSIHGALILGLRDYIRKCGFKKVVLGLSGGIDSAVTIAIAAEALGSENVFGGFTSRPLFFKRKHRRRKKAIRESWDRL